MKMLEGATIRIALDKFYIFMNTLKFIASGKYHTNFDQFGPKPAFYSATLGFFAADAISIGYPEFKWRPLRVLNLKRIFVLFCLLSSTVVFASNKSCRDPLLRKSRHSRVHHADGREGTYEYDDTERGPHYIESDRSDRDHDNVDGYRDDERSTQELY